MTNLEKRVRAEQVRILYGHTFTLAVSHPCGGALLVWIFWNVVDHKILLSWLACLTLVSISRVPPYLAFRRRKSDEHSIQSWGNFYIFMACLQGAIWGTAWWIFIPLEDPIYLAICATWMIGLSATGVVGYSAYLAVLLAYFFPVMVPGTIHLFVIGGSMGTGLGLALVLYTLVVLRTVMPVNKSLVDSIRLNFTLEEEINERKRVEEQLREISIKDSLTGLSNRRHFDEVLASELRRSQRVSHPLSLVLIDIDYFKAFNDTYGHLEGDACLQRISRVIEKTINRPGDLVSRYGGEEFAVILSNTNTDTAFKITEAIRRGVEAMAVPHAGSELSGVNTLTISAGVTTATATRETLPADIVHRADLALYQAKRDGRNRVVVSDTEFK